MRIHKEGYKIIGPLFVALLLFAAIIHYLLPIQQDAKVVMYIGLFLLIAWLTFFFRYPKREVNYGDHILSTADGKVVAIEEVEEPEYFKGKRLQVSVFMSGFDVHVNWYPISGTVKYTNYHPGNYFMAKKPKSSSLNERSTIVIEQEKGKDILVRQVAGIMARRIVFHCKEGDRVKQGDELGMIRLGSRIDFFLPPDAIVEVNIGDKVKAQKTVIARFREEKGANG